MHSLSELGPRIIFNIGSINITETVVFAWIISALMIIFAYFATRNMQRVPKGAQAVGELIVEFIYNMVEDTMGKRNVSFAPYIGTIIIFIMLSNIMGIIDQRPVTADINTTFALAAITFILIHYNAVRSRGLFGYIHHLGSPNALLFPINLISELAFPISLSFRLFGNIMGGMILIWMLLGALGSVTAGFSIPIPFLQIAIPLPLNFFFDLFEGFLQAYIFAVLTMVFVSNGMKEEV